MTVNSEHIATLEELDIHVVDEKGRVYVGTEYSGKLFSVKQSDKGTTVLSPIYSKKTVEANVLPAEYGRFLDHSKTYTAL